jgi:hypothetical protein
MQKQGFEFGHGASLVAGDGAVDSISLNSKDLKTDPWLKFDRRPPSSAALRFNAAPTAIFPPRPEMDNAMEIT